jgi:hypothetical protein
MQVLISRRLDCEKGAVSDVRRCFVTKNIESGFPPNRRRRHDYASPVTGGNHASGESLVARERANHITTAGSEYSGGK